MAKRIVFLPTLPDENLLYQEVLVNFEWIAGMAISQARKSVTNLHVAIKDQVGARNTLEISTKSLSDLGIRLSAFNLQVNLDGLVTSVEAAYQSSKVFENGGPYLDLLNRSSIEAKQDHRLRNSGKIVNFEFENQTWPIRKAPNLYDFLYIRGLLQSNDRQELVSFNAFTDIAFSQVSLDYKHGRSYNCQARSAAMFNSLSNRMQENEMLDYLQIQGLEGEELTEQLDLF